MSKLRFQGEAFGSDFSIISFTAVPYFMLQLPNTVGGSPCLLAKGRLSCNPTLQPAHSPPSGIWKWKCLPGFERRGYLLFVLLWGYLLPSQSREEMWEMQLLQEGTSNSFCTLRGASPRTPTVLTVKPLSSLATRQPFLLSSNEWRVLLCCFLLSSVFLAQLHQSPANWLTDLPNDCQAPFLVYSNHIIGMASPAGKQCKVTSLCLPRRGQESYNWGKNSMNILILGVLISFKFCLKPKHNLTLHTDSSNTHIHKHTHDERSYRAFWGCDPQIFFIWHTLDA